MRIAAWIVLAAWVGFPAAAVAAEPRDFSGTWLPDARRAEAWPAVLPLTPVARAFMESFDPTRSDPTTFCMPLGTPRNMLQTAYPLEIVQTQQRIVILVQPNLANAEVRRIPLNGGELPASPEPSWFGTSRGRWEGSTLVIETMGMRADAIVSGSGLPHSEQLRVVERMRVTNDQEHGKVLVDDIELHDPQAYQQPLKTRRYYSWAPDARAQDSSCVDGLWIDKLWRDRLQEHAESARQGEAAR